MRKIVYVSLFLNVVCLLALGYVVYQKGGINYLRKKMHLPVERPKDHPYGIYHSLKESVFAELPADSSDIIFFGDSITDYGNLSELFGDPHIKNRGISGDGIDGLLNRIPAVSAGNPRKLFILIGANDMGPDKPADFFLQRYDSLLRGLRSRLPQTDIYIESILPTRDYHNVNNQQIQAINASLKQLAGRYNAAFINLYDAFAATDNKLKSELSFDGVHINGKGYAIMKAMIEPYLHP